MFVLLGIVGGVVMVSYNKVIDSTTNTDNKSMLHQTAGSLLLYEQSRGYFPEDSATLHRAEPHAQFNAPPTGESTQEGVISLKSSVVGGNHLGLAVLGTDGICYTLTVFAAGLGQPYSTSKFTPNGTEAPCSGEYALTRPVGQDW